MIFPLRVSPERRIGEAIVRLATTLQSSFALGVLLSTREVHDP
jgi:hypothetical protein